MKFNLSFFLSLFLFLVPTALFAGEFQAIVGIPGVTENITGTSGLNDYINALYRLSISIAALLAVIKIVAAGAKYMLSDIITNKEEAKKDIQGALIGLLIVIAAVIILNTINSDLTRVNFNLEPLVAPTSTAPVAPPVDPTVALCNDPSLGGCTLRACDSLDDYTLEFAVGGAAAGGLGGMAVGAAAGSGVPIVGNTALGILGGIGGLAVGGIGGTLVGIYAQTAATEAECSIVCNWLDGTIVNNSCWVPNNAEVFIKAQFDAFILQCTVNPSANTNCCLASGGTLTNNNSNCLLGAVVPIPDGQSGNINVDRASCMSTTVYRWDAITNNCREQPIVREEAPLPGSAEDYAGVTEDLLRVACSAYGPGWTYDSETEVCYR